MTSLLGYTCSRCQLECIVDCARCGICQNRYHFTCLGPDFEEKVFDSNVLFSCPTCFSFEGALDRLNIALCKNWELVNQTAEMEKNCISFLKEPQIKNITSSNINSSIDDFSNDLLQSYGESDFVAFSSSKDGSCLFNALSLALYGSEIHSKELRVKALIELLLNEPEIRFRLPDNAWKVTRDYQETVFECACNKQWLF